MSFELWRRLRAKRPTELRCSFCNKSQRDVLKLIAGPAVYICNECADICSDLVADDEKAYLGNASERGDTAACELCRREKPSAHLLHVPNRGPVCFTCVAAIKVAAGSAWDFRSD